MPAKAVIVLGNNLCESCTQDYCVCHFICTNERSVNWGNIDFGKYLGGLDKDVRWDLLLCAQKINDISKWIQYIKWVDVDSMKGNGIPIGSTFYWWKKKAQDTEFEDDYYWQDKIALGRHAKNKKIISYYRRICNGHIEANNISSENCHWGKVNRGRTFFERTEKLFGVLVSSRRG